MKVDPDNEPKVTRKECKGNKWITHNVDLDTVYVLRLYYMTNGNNSRYRRMLASLKKLTRHKFIIFPYVLQYYWDGEKGAVNLKPPGNSSLPKLYIR